MFKLLPDAKRKEVMQEYLVRRSVIMFSALSLLALIATIGLLPSYVISMARNKDAKQSVETRVPIELKVGEENLTTWLTDINQKLALLDPKLDQDHPSMLLEEVLAIKGEGIEIKSFVSGTDRVGKHLTIVGLASDRQSLLEFEKALSDSDLFLDVSLPVSNLAHEKDINFQMRLIPKAKPK